MFCWLGMGFANINIFTKPIFYLLEDVFELWFLTWSCIVICGDFEDFFFWQPLKSKFSQQCPLDFSPGKTCSFCRMKFRSVNANPFVSLSDGCQVPEIVHSCAFDAGISAPRSGSLSFLSVYETLDPFSIPSWRKVETGTVKWQTGIAQRVVLGVCWFIGFTFHAVPIANLSAFNTFIFIPALGRKKTYEFHEFYLHHWVVIPVHLCYSTVRYSSFSCCFYPKIGLWHIGFDRPWRRIFTQWSSQWCNKYMFIAPHIQ